MSETPLQFRYQGSVAKLRVDAARLAAPPLPVARVPRRGRRTWGWLVVASLGLAGVLVWNLGIQLPARGPETVEISSPSMVLAEPTAPEITAAPRPAVVSAPSREVVPETSSPSQAPPRRRPPRVAATVAPPSGVVARLSLGRIETPDREHAARLRIAASAVLEPIRNCCEDLMQNNAELKGTIAATVAVREGRVTSVNVESAVRNTRLRMCFREGLIGLAVQSASSPFDARLEFFLVPRPAPTRR